jgi:acetylornithine deacetylase/succinyl-diaminopimelate desuccinylase-like protein
MTDTDRLVAELARDLVAIDSRSFVSNLAVAERVEEELSGFEIERLDYTDASGVQKRALVAHRGPNGGLALSGHMDTVPDTGWQEDPWSGKIENGILHGLGSTDMKGPTAAAIVAARALPEHVPITLLITTDEETTKAGARAIVERSELARRVKPTAIIVAEPTKMIPVRGHRANVAIVATATGLQAHSSTGRGRNANWQMLPFLMEMRAIYERLQTDKALQDGAYDPPFSDFNLVIDNHGTAVNVTVPKATALIKFRYSKKIDPNPVIVMVREAAQRTGIELKETWEGTPPELREDHPAIVMCAELAGVKPTVAPYGTDASQLQAIAPCVVLGPGDIFEAHKPQECVSLAELAAAVPVFMRAAERMTG